MRQQVQLRLIEEVNNQQTTINKQGDFDNDCDKQLVPREGNIGLRSSLIEYNSTNNETYQNHNAKKTRAQMVPRSETLAPVFKTLSSRSSQII